MTLNSVSRFSCFLVGVLPAETQRGAFLFLLGSCSVCFLLGSSSVFRALLLPPEKETFRPSLRGVCVRSGRLPCHHPPFSTAAGGWSRPVGHCHGSWRAKVPFLPFSPQPAEPQLYSRLTSCTRTMRDLSVVLETHQLYSRLISCTRKISTLHLEFKCV